VGNKEQISLTWTGGDGGGSALTEWPSADVAIVQAATAAERQRLVSLRADGTIGDAAFQRIEQELDWTELDLQQLLRTGAPGDED
jgi:monovalent cation/hydrogen antiporter